MSLVYVTGLSGTGKSAVLRELRARGYHARGVDEDGYGDWVNRTTGCPDPFPRGDPGFDFHTITRRLGRRPDAFGKTPAEVADVLAWQAGFETVYRGFGATIVDATRPLPDVVAEILAASTGPFRGPA